jgi:murein L,D-transpeptidase YcbB/YkuD
LILLEFTLDDVKQYTEIKQWLEINLGDPIPIFIQYFTAEVNSDSLAIYADVYNQDEFHKNKAYR